MRKVGEIKEVLFAHQDLDSYKEVYPESGQSKAPAPLRVKEVLVDGSRYILCYNSKQARKDAADREAILESLRERIGRNRSALVGNKGYRKYLKVNKNSFEIDEDKIAQEALFDGKWVLQSNLNRPADEIALKYKDLWRVENAFRDIKSTFDTRPIFHQLDQSIRGHVFCSFLALILRKELEEKLENVGYDFEWAEIKQDLSALQETIITENGKTLSIRSECQGVCGNVFQAVGVALPPTIREL